MALFKNINFSKLKEGLSKTRDKIVQNLTEAVIGKAVIDEKTLDDIEEILVASDIGYDIANKIIENVRIDLVRSRDRTEQGLIEAVKKELETILQIPFDNSDKEDYNKYKPYVILVVGVNGTGKTTTVGKLAHNYKQAGFRVIVGAADTFRAAANEQL